MIKCVIVDDEPIAQDILETYTSKTPNLELVAKCSNALEAMSVLQENKVDLLFLDIQMPEITGLDFLKSLSNPPLVIFTTAYQEYAIESYELNAVDYLLKPISLERFLTAVNKVFTRLETMDESIEKDYIFIKDSDEHLKIWFKDILYIEGLKDYVKIIRNDAKTIVTLSTMKNMEKIMPSQFKRIHRSHIINTNKITSIVGNSVRIGGELISSGKSYKEVFDSLKAGL